MTIATNAPHLAPGTVIDGSYTLGAVVRTRASSATYEATDLSGGKVEVTVYGPDCFVSPVALERSLRELRQLEKVQSSHIVRVFDAGKMPQGGIYEVHERVTGTPLSALGALPAGDVVQVIQDVAAALAAAQKVGVVHRNLGADSVLRSGRDIRLIHFAVGDPQGGVSFGAIDCIAPEQVEGKNIDERTLVYNLAALTYRLLQGQPLFTAEDTGTALLQHAASLPPENSMPAALFAALAKDPKARPALSKFLGDLDAIVREFPSRSSDPRPEERMNDSASSPDRTAKPSVEPAATPTPPPAAKPVVAPPPAVGPKIAPSVIAPGVIAPPPPVASAKPPAAPAAPPSITPPSITPPTIAPPTVAPPTITPPTLSAPPAAAPASPAPSTKPRTRGWTMFMEATESETNHFGSPGVPVPAPTPVAAPAPVQPAVPQPGEAKPSTRGWTMIMDEPSEADAAALAVTTPAAASAPAPTSPTTRGWTMLEELNDGLPTPPASEVVATPGPAGGQPSSRGWTMFMEAELDKKDDAAETEFYDGQVTTDSGTVVAFAPSAEAPNARAKADAPPPDLSSGTEELTSFGSRFRPAEPEPEPPPAPPAEAQPTPSELPSFTGNSSFDFGGLTPPAQPQPDPGKPPPVKPAPEPEPAAGADADEAASGSSRTLLIVILLLVIAAVVVLAMTQS